MIVVIDGKTFDSSKTPILLVLHHDEIDLFGGMKRFVSAPEDSTEEERQKLIDMEVI